MCYQKEPFKNDGSKSIKQVRDIQSEMEELYGIDVSPAMISKITDKVVEAAAECQSIELDEIYPIVYMDAMHFKVRDDNKIVSKATYIWL